MGDNTEQQPPVEWVRGYYRTKPIKKRKKRVKFRWREKALTKARQGGKRALPFGRSKYELFQ